MQLNNFETISKKISYLFTDNKKDFELASSIKIFIQESNAQLVSYLAENTTDIENVVSHKVYGIDTLLQKIWAHFFQDSNELALAAVGGYGRRELMPYSDIDLVILINENVEEKYAEKLSQFVTFLWDTGLDIGSSVRTVQDCETEAGKDLTIVTNLMEAIYLAGNESLIEEMLEVISPEKMWDKKAFFQGKIAEKNSRYERFNDGSYKLEPNLKESPGGLRDIHNIIWVLKRAFGVHQLKDIRNLGFIQHDEYEALIEGRNFLWLIRFLLHGQAKRREDRVLFNYQQILSEILGYQGERLNDKIEQLMQRYFRTITELSRLNELLLQLFREEIIFKDQKQVVEKINNRFQVRNGYLETKSDQLFNLFPPAILETFVILSTHEDIRGVRADTIRQIRNSLPEINEEFRSDSISNTLFIQLFRYPNGLTHQLRRMARYGVLNKYIPAFENVSGRMQYDLFHVYTVDQHTLVLVRNLRRFAIEEHKDEFPDCSEIIKKLPKNEVLFLAGLFHDIGKGQDGDHSKVGAKYAKEFAIQHEMSSVDRRLLVWLVANHLNMSMTAQRKDLTDPETIYQFAKQVGSINYLQQLYLLTVCDIRATNPETWSDWKYQLLKDLYRKTLTVLQRGLDNPIDIGETIFEKKQSCLKQLIQDDFKHEQITQLWSTFRKSYFIHYDESEILIHTSAILNHHAETPLVLFYNNQAKQCTNIFIYTQNTDALFSVICHSLDKLDLNILESRIIVSKKDMSLFSFSLLNNNLESFDDHHTIEKLKERMLKALSQPDEPEKLQPKRQYHTHKHFKVFMDFDFSRWNDLSVLHISATDAPGVLSVITRVLFKSQVRVHNAKIGTIGEKIDDVFFISSLENHHLNDDEINKLKNKLINKFKQHYQAISDE